MNKRAKSENLLNIDIAKITFEQEISELQQVAERLGADFLQSVQSILDCKGKVVVVGIGKSAHIANKIVATFNSTGTTSQFLHAAEAIHGDLGLLNKEDVVLCLSKSGNSQEIKYILPTLKKNSSSVIAITGNLNSELAKYADYILDVTVSKEVFEDNLAPTSSTTAQLVMGDALALTLVKARNFTSNDFAKFHPGGALGKKLLWNVEDVVDENQKPSVSIDDSIHKVIDSLTSGRHGITVVMNGNKIEGVITDGDLRRMLQKHTDFSNLKAKDVLTKVPKTIFSDEKASIAFQKISQYNIGQLVVLNRKNQYVGILDIHSLINEGIEP